MNGNKIGQELCQHLKLDPQQVSVEGFQAEIGITEMVKVTWTGIAYMSTERFQEIVERANDAVR